MKKEPEVEFFNLMLKNNGFDCTSIISGLVKKAGSLFVGIILAFSSKSILVPSDLKHRLNGSLCISSVCFNRSKEITSNFSIPPQ